VRKYGHSDLDYTKVNSKGIPGYDDYGRAISTFTPGRETGWSGVFIDTPGQYQLSVATVDWSGNIYGGWRYALPNGNTLRADPSHVQVGDGGGIGYPNTFDLTRDATYAFQVVDVKQNLVSGVGPSPNIGAIYPMFAFHVYNGRWDVLEFGGVALAGNTISGNTFFAIYFNSSIGTIEYYVNGVLVHYSGLVPVAPLAIQATFFSQDAEIANATFSRVAPASKMWWKVAYDNQTLLSAFIQLAADTDLYVRQAKIGITPQRQMEMGAFGNLTPIRLIDGSGGDPVAMQENENVRVVKVIRQRGPDFRNLVNTATPLGGGTGDSQVTLEHLWRILFDPAYVNFGREVGGPLAKSKGVLFPEYDPNYPIQRVPMDAGGYEYYMRSLTSIAQWDEMYGGTPDPTYTYQTDSNSQKAFVELTERGLYSSWIGKFRKNDQPHYSVEVDTVWGRTTPRAGDKVTVDYTGYGFSNNVSFNRMRVNDTFYVMKIERIFGPEVVDRWTLSNLGRYATDSTTASAAVARSVQAMQVVTNTALSVSILGLLVRELDSGNPDSPDDHSIIYPIKILPTCFQVQAAYFHVDFFPFRQTSTTSDNSAATINIDIPTQQVEIEATNDINIQHIGTPTYSDTTGYDTTIDPIGGVPTHYHNVLVVASQIANPGGFPIHIASTPTDITPDRYVWMAGDGPDNMALISNGHGGSMRTGQNESYQVNLDPTKAKHTVPIKQTIAAAKSLIGNIRAQILHAPLPLHTHAVPAKINDSLSPYAIQVWIDSGDGNFVNRTAELLDLSKNGPAGNVSGSSGGVSVAGPGFTSSFDIEVSRFIDSPGRLVRLKFVSIGNASNPYGLGALGISATIAASYGGLGEIIRQSQ
jgi:hypothetical protein